jgi:hypothetical protein
MNPKQEKYTSQFETDGESDIKPQARTHQVQPTAGDGGNYIDYNLFKERTPKHTHRACANGMLESVSGENGQ